MSIDEPTLRATRDAQLLATLADLGYAPVRKLPWVSTPQTWEAYADATIDRDLATLRSHSANLVGQIQRLRPDTDAFSLPVLGDTASLTFNETLAKTHRFLKNAADQVDHARARYAEVASETPSDGSQLSAEDLTYAIDEAKRRRS